MQFDTTIKIALSNIIDNAIYSPHISIFNKLAVGLTSMTIMQNSSIVATVNIAHNISVNTQDYFDS